MTDLVGTTLGQYQIVELIGEGGMARVYKAWQPNLRRYVALKVLAPHLSNDAEFIKRFHQEAVSAANLKQANIVTIHDVGTENGYHYIAMEYIEGTSLEDRIRSGQAFAPEQVVDIVSQIGRALDYAHQRGFIHRDIKPANILIDQTGRVVLTDFGIVKALTGSGVTAATTKAGTIFGTPHYMSPEQIKEEPVDHRSDLYGLGVVCYEMLSGQVPFDGTTTHSILYAQAHNPPPPLREIVGPTVSQAIDAVVNKMLSKQPEARYNSAGEFAEALSQAVAGVWQGDVGDQPTVIGVPRPDTGPTVVQRPDTGPTAVGRQAAGGYYGPSTSAVPARRSRWPLVVGLMGIVLVLAAIVVAAVLLLPTLQGENRLEKGRDALASGNYTEAVYQFEQVLNKDPENAEALNGLLDAASAQAQGGEYSAAIDTFKMALEFDTDNVAALKGIGQAYEAQEQWQLAADWYEKWTQVVPDDAEARLALGWSYYYLEDYEQAVAQFSRVTGSRPDLPGGFEGLGRTYVRMQDNESALEPLKKWRELEPDSVEANRWLGNTFYELRRYNEAIPVLNRWAELSPEDPMAHNKLGWTYRFAGQYEESADQFQQALNLQPDLTGSLWGLGDSLVQLGRLNEALAVYQQWQQIEPENATIYLRLGQLFSNSGDYEAAIDVLRQSLELEESDNAYSSLVAVYKQLGQDEDIVQICLQWIDLSPANASAYIELGWAYRRLGRYGDAVEPFQQAVELKPDSSSAYQGLGNSYVDLNEFRQALSAFEIWAELAPNDARAFRNIGWTHYRLAEYVQAIAAFERSLELEDHFGAYLGLGHSYKQLGDCARAKVFFTKVLELEPGQADAVAGLEACKQSVP